MEKITQNLQEDIQGWDAIADHRTGTTGDHETATWLVERIRAAGAEPHLDTFPFTRRICHECAISVGEKRAEGIPAFDGPYTTEEGLSAPLTTASDDPTGISVIPFAPSGEHPPTPLHTARSGANRAIVAYPNDTKVVPGLALVNAPRYGEPYGPPLLQVATEHGEWLEVAASEGAQAHFVAHVTLEETTASNVQAKIAGRDPSLAPLVIMTPRSAWWTCTAERAGGISLWLASIRHLVDNRPERDVIFTANTGHELGHIGLERYLAQQPDLVRDAHAWIHLGANFSAVDCGIWYQASPDLMQLGLDALAAEGITPARLTPAGKPPTGEANNIYRGGGRYLSLVADNRWFHHPDDRWPHTIDLEGTFRLHQALINSVAVLVSA